MKQYTYPDNTYNIESSTYKLSSFYLSEGSTPSEKSWNQMHEQSVLRPGSKDDAGTVYSPPPPINPNVPLGNSLSPLLSLLFAYGIFLVFRKKRKIV